MANSQEQAQILVPDNSPRTQAISDILASGPNLSLAQWLDVSWFYPEGFQKEQIIETDRAWTVIGNQFAYKFLKVPRTQEESPFRARWKQACEEVLDNQPLAGEAYVGLRLLRWLDDEPHWISEVHHTLHPLRPPQGADDVAIVLHRLPEERFLNRILESDREISTARIEALAKKLSSFHQRQSPIVQTEFHSSPHAPPQALSLTYSKNLRDFLSQFGSYLDPFSQLALQEVSAFISCFIEKHSDVFLERARSGLTVECHGQLRADDICYWKQDTETYISIFGRQVREQATRVRDALSDIASLTIDLEMRGFYDVAIEFEEIYFSYVPTAYNKELYRFFRAAEAARAAERFLRSALERQNDFAPTLLSLALKYSLGLTQPFLLVVSSAQAETGIDLARSVSELTPCKLVDPTLLSQDGILSALPAEIQLERLLCFTSILLNEGKSVVLQWPLNREEERKRIVDFASERNIPYRLIHAQLGRAEESVRRSQMYRDDSSEMPSQPSELRVFRAKSTPEHFPFELIEPVLPPPELALSVLRGFSRS